MQDKARLEQDKARKEGKTKLGWSETKLEKRPG
jgi:hypothetical protein